MSFLGFFKYVLFIYNFIVMVLGGTLLGVAVYFYVDSLQYIEVSARTWPIYSTFFILIIGIGLLTFIVGFFGCCGACKESSCMLCLYFTIIIAICGLIGALIFLPEKFDIKPQQMKLDLQEDVREVLQRSYSRYNTSSFANLIIDKIQTDFQCCGASNYTDWINSLQNNSTRPDIGVGNGAVSYIVAPASSTSAINGNSHLHRQSSSYNSRQPESQHQYYNNQYNQQLQQQQQPMYQTGTTTFRVPVSCCSKYNEGSYSQCKSMIERYDANPNEQQVQRIPNVIHDGCVDRIHNYLFVTHWLPLNIIGGLAIGLQGLSLIFSLCLCCAINRAMSDDDYDDDDQK